MIDRDTIIKIEKLIQLVAPGARLVRAWVLDGGISATMLGFEIERSDGSRAKLISRHPGQWALDRNVDAAATEFVLLERLHGQGLAVPEPIYLDEDKKIFPHVSIVLGFVEGAPEFDPQDIPRYATRFAKQLFDIHQIGFAGLQGVSGAWQAVTSRINWDVEEPDHRQKDLEIRALLKEVQPRIEPGPSVFLHGDFWPGNTIWHDGEIICVIDWEEPHIGDALYDVSITRSELLFAFGEGAMEVFTDAYQDLSGVDLSNLAFWDLCAALRPMGNFAAWAGSWLALGRDDITEESMRVLHLKFVAQALAKLTP